MRCNAMQAETWLDEDGWDATKSAYVEKITELRKIGDPIAARKWEADHRKEVRCAGCAVRPCR